MSAPDPMPNLFSRFAYYARSIVTLLTGFRAPHRIVASFCGARIGSVEMRRTGWRFAVRNRLDVWIIKETCIDRDYLRDFAIDPHWSVIDVGAGIGDFATLAASECSHGIVHAYEPDPRAFAFLRENLDRNGAAHVSTFAEAVGTTSCDLATIVNRLPTGQRHLLKIDCEGCEFDLLMRAEPETLERVSRLSLETHDGVGENSTAELVDFLVRHGFDVRTRPSPVHEHLGFLTATRRDDRTIDYFQRLEPSRRREGRASSQPELRRRK